jgi:energy-coupling factor transporter ATP-binding protein EcfA2
MLNWITIENYKSFRATPQITFSSGWNVIVGKNNSGKSSLLKSLRLYSLTDNPYRGVGVDPNLPGDPKSRVRYSISIPGQNLLRLFDQHTLFPFGYKDNETRSPQQALDALINEGHLRVESEFIPSAGTRTLMVFDHLGNQLHPTNKFHVFRYDVHGRRLVPANGSPDGDSLFASLSSSAFQLNSYFFDAERMNIGVHRVGPTLTLASNASNLAEVVLRLRESPRLFDHYNELVTEVFPDIQAVVPTIIGDAMVEIKISTTPRPQDRRELHVSLSDSGTGVSQVLAILYVVVTSQSPHLIVIDEPNSFLHPGAAKQLIRILKRFPQHQFIISTHSPEIISEISPDTLLVVKWTQDGSVVTAIDKGVRGLRETLREIGAQFSDLFGLDGVIFVEGETEVSCFAAILESKDKELKRGVEFVKIGEPDKLTGQKATKYIEEYQRLFKAVAAMPPVVAFCRDRETLTATEVADLDRVLGEKLKLLPRRCYENFLLHPEGISALLGEKGTTISAVVINEWIINNATESVYWREEGSNHQAFSEPWLTEIDGARLMKKLISKLTETRWVYNKPKDGEFLTRWILENDPNHLEDLVEFVVGLSSIEAPEI